MSQPAATPSPASEPASGSEPVAPDAETAAADAVEEAEAPLNRAARRAKAKGSDPSHVGPRSGNVRHGRAPRSNSKRPR